MVITKVTKGLLTASAEFCEHDTSDPTAMPRLIARDRLYAAALRFAVRRLERAGESDTANARLLLEQLASEIDDEIRAITVKL